MPIQILGIFDSVFNWVYDKLLSPVLSWFATILGNAFTWVFENILEGFLLEVFKLLWDYVLVYIANFLFRWIYTLFCALLSLLDCLQSCFDVLIGLEDITYGNGESATLLNYILFNDTTRNALIAVTIVAVVLTVIFSIYSVIHSSFDLGGDNRRPVSKVLGMTVKSLMTFLFIPAICWVGLNLAGSLLKATSLALQGGKNLSVSKMILAISSSNAAMNDADFSLTASPWSGLMDGITDYLGFAFEVNISEIDYLIGYSSLIFCTIIMLACLFMFIKRIYDVVMLYIVSPYFASTMVLDDGKKFSQWRSMFIGRIVLGFGSAIGMRLFLMIVPIIMDDKLQFFDSTLVNATAGYVLKLLFILGGMYAVFKSAGMLTSIVNHAAGMEEQRSFDGAVGRIRGAAMKAGRGVGGKLKGAFGTGAAGAAAAGAGAKAGGAFRGGAPSDGAYSLDGAGGKPSLVDDVPDMGDDLQRLFGEQDYATDLTDQIKDDYEQPSDMIRLDGEAMSDSEEAAKRDIFDGVTMNDDYATTPELPPEDTADNSAVFDTIPDNPDMIKVGGEQAPTGEEAKAAADRDIFAGVDVLGDYAPSIEAAENDDVYNAETFGDDDDELFSGGDFSHIPGGKPIKEEREPLQTKINVPETDYIPSNFIHGDYTRTENRGVSRVGVGNKVFDIPQGYTAFPKLVKSNKVQERIESMKQSADPSFGSYYDAMMQSTTGLNGYSVPAVRGGNLGYGSFTQVNGVKLNVPSGYTVVPEIMKISDVQNIATNYGGGKNSDFYKEFTSNLVEVNYNDTPPQTAPQPRNNASDIAALEAQLFGGDDNNQQQ